MEENKESNILVSDYCQSDNSTKSQECYSCGTTNIEKEYETPLCYECRKKLSGRKIPIYIKIASIIVISLMVFSSIKMPQTIKNGIVYNKGIIAYKAKKYNEALNHFGVLRNTYPKSNEITGWIALTLFVNKEYSKAFVEFKKLPKKDNGLSSDLRKELNLAFNALNQNKGGK